MIKYRKLIFPILLIGLAIIFWKLTRNKVDPDWIKLKNLNLSQIQTLENSPELLKKLYEDFHEKKIDDVNYPVSLINKPYIPIMEFAKFEKYIRALKNEKRIVISTVEGGGSTTLVNRLARFIAEDEKRIMNVMCAPQFDLIYHKKLIGEEVNGKFIKGKLLLFWEMCSKNPDAKCVAIFDDFDKVNPETVFGPDLWENIFNSKYKLFVAGQEVKVPKNFYMISTTESAVGSRIKLHNEHFKRIGRNYYLKPNTIELALYLERVKNQLNKKAKEKGIENLSDIDKKRLAALNDRKNVFEFLYIFEKTNEIIEQEVSKKSQLAQWSNIRKLYLPENRDKLIETFITHVNSISPDVKFNRANLEPIFYSLKNNGLLKYSSPLATGFKVFKDWGFLTEFVVALSFALITALFGLYVNRKRKKQITKFLTKSEEIFAEFQSRNIDTDKAIDKLNALKKEIEQNTKDNKLSFPEAIFFYNSIRSKVNSIEITKNINSTFLLLMDVFLEDNVLSKKEYNKLMAFIDKIEYTIPKKDIEKMKEQVNKAWKEFGGE